MHDPLTQPGTHLEPVQRRSFHTRAPTSGARTPQEIPGAIPPPHHIAAARRLGHTRTTINDARQKMRTWHTQNPDNLHAYQNALATVAHTIATAADPVNYEHRREQMRTWHLPGTVWTYLLNRTRTYPPRYDIPLDKAVAAAFV
ncbi:hypothetical protein ACFWZT_14135 [Streptomyces alboflavus]|uniref:hypothetical protein n=1 Tax=Streptomyces alboflavus TaxID=67267 RepID=UPI0036A84516